ncbi:hypothetical protein TWF694_007605 [Orbilia ellipsospora]|uniref:Uncharacterized protein n=1 Tax=Orbilia ellipsospora TaxID=2528407 RepID=A0AAV9XI79_9PEZI
MMAGDPNEEFRVLSNDVDALTKNIAFQLSAVLPPCAEQIVLALENAMTTLYKLAIFIRGDYDLRPADIDQQKSLTGLAIKAFQLTLQLLTGPDQAVKRYYDALGIMSKQLESMKTSLTAALKIFEEQAKELEDIQKREQKELHRLENDYSVLRLRKMELGMGQERHSGGLFDFFGAEVIGAAEHGSRANEIEDRIVTIRKEMDKAAKSSELAFLTGKEASRQASKIEINLTSLSGLHMIIESLEAKCLEYGKNLAQLEQTCATTSTKMADLMLKSERALNTNAKLTKLEWVDSILEICSAAIVTKRLRDEVQLIVSEIKKEWGSAGAIPTQCAVKIDGLIKETETDN